MKENILVVHGGAPTAVMNASLYGVIREAEKYPNIDHIYAAIGGSGGILKEHFLDLKTIEKDKIESLPYTPASAIGTSRDALENSLCFYEWWKWKHGYLWKNLPCMQRKKI